MHLNPTTPVVLDLMVLLILASLIVITLLRIWSILPHKGRGPSLTSPKRTRSLAAFLGSGGHTSEMVQLLRALDFERYTPRTYILKSAMDQPPKIRIITLPRAREVHQSLITTQFTALRSLAHALIELSVRPALRGEPLADLLLLNGPGTCVAVVGAIYCSRFLGLPTPRLIYIESFTRVKNLSLSGRLLRPLVDRFIVQWPQLIGDGKRGEFRGWLV